MSADPNPGGPTTPLATPPAPAPVAATPPAPEPTPDPNAPPAPAAAPAPPQDWRDRRIAQLTAKLAEERARNATAPAPTPSPVASPPGTGAPNAGAVAPTYAPGSPEFEAAVAARASQVAQVQRFNEDCNATAAAGQAKFGKDEFNARVTAMWNQVDHGDPQAVLTYNSFLMAAMKTGSGADVLHDVGADPNEFARIIALSPIEMAVELTRRAAKLEAAGGSPPAPATPPVASSLPKPPTPVGRVGNQHTPIDPADPQRAKHLSTKEWMDRREAQAQERFKQKMGAR